MGDRVMLTIGEVPCAAGFGTGRMKLLVLVDPRPPDNFTSSRFSFDDAQVTFMREVDNVAVQGFWNHYLRTS